MQGKLTESTEEFESLRKAARRSRSDFEDIKRQRYEPIVLF